MVALLTGFVFLALCTGQVLGELCYYSYYYYYQYSYYIAMNCDEGCCGYINDRYCCSSGGTIAGAIVACIIFFIGILTVIIVIKSCNRPRTRTGVFVTSTSNPQSNVMFVTTQMQPSSNQPYAACSPGPPPPPPGPAYPCPAYPGGSYPTSPPAYDALDPPCTPPPKY